MAPQPPRVSIIIPTWNGGERLGRALRAIRSQTTADPYEIVVIDSGSTDGTLAICAEAGVRLLSVPHESYGHGRTRNEAIAACRGEYVVLTVQDAIPANDRWLAALVQTLDDAPDAAGAYSRHLPHEDAGFVARQVATYWHRRMGARVEQRVDDWQAFANLPLAEKQTLCTFNDISSIIRRSVWERHPLPDLPYAEDLSWAYQVMRAGHAIIYEPASVVYHSHERSAAYELCRACIDARTVGDIFGEPSRPLTMAQAQALLARWREIERADAEHIGTDMARRLETVGEASLDLCDDYRRLFTESALRAMLTNRTPSPQERSAWVDMVRHRYREYVWEPYNRRVDEIVETRETRNRARELAAACAERRLGDLPRTITALAARAVRPATWADAGALLRVAQRRSERLEKRLDAVSQGNAARLNARQMSIAFDPLWSTAARAALKQAVLYDDPATEADVARTELRARQMAHDYVREALAEGVTATPEVCAEICLYAWSVAIGRRLGQATRQGTQPEILDYISAHLEETV